MKTIQNCLTLLLLTCTLIAQAQNKPLKQSDMMPRFPGCEDMTATIKEKKQCAGEKMMDFIYDSLRYPSKAIAYKTQGSVVLSLLIDKDGTISNVEVIRGLKHGCTEEALHIVNSMPKWVPGTKNGQSVQTQLTLPIPFKIQNPSPDSLLKIMPRFPGCEDMEGTELEKSRCAESMLFQFIAYNIKYPAEATKNGIEGVAVVAFIVEIDGSMRNFEILSDPGGRLGEEAIRICTHMPNWIPATQGGELIPVRFILPVKFEFEGYAEPKKKRKSFFRQ